MYGIGFEPYMPKGMTMPDGYELAGESGLTGGGKRVTLYYWSKDMPDGDIRFGPDVTDKRKAVRQAWRDSRMPGADVPSPTTGEAP